MRIGTDTEFLGPEFWSLSLSGTYVRCIPEWPCGSRPPTSCCWCPCFHRDDALITLTLSPGWRSSINNIHEIIYDLSKCFVKSGSFGKFGWVGFVFDSGDWTTKGEGDLDLFPFELCDFDWITKVYGMSWVFSDIIHLQPHSSVGGRYMIMITVVASPWY